MLASVDRTVRRMKLTTRLARKLNEVLLDEEDFSVTGMVPQERDEFKRGLLFFLRFAELKDDFCFTEATA